MKLSFKLTPEGKVPQPYIGLLQQELIRLAGKEIVFEVKKAKKRRSESQSSFMHGPFFDSLYDMYLEFGNEYDRELIKAIFKRKFGPKIIVREPDGSESYQDKQSREWTTEECEVAMENARRHYAEFWQLPFPNEIPIEAYEAQQQG